MDMLDTDPPPILGSWPRLYLAVMLWVCALVLFFIFIGAQFQ